MDIWDNWTAYKHNAFADDVVIYIKRTEHNQHTALRVRKILKAIIFNNRSESGKNPKPQQLTASGQRALMRGRIAWRFFIEES